MQIIDELNIKWRIELSVSVMNVMVLNQLFLFY